MSRLHDAKLAFARAQLKIWKAKLRREYAKWAEKEKLVEFIREMGEQIKQAALEASADLTRTAALDHLPQTIDAEIEGIEDELLRFDVRPEEVEQINKTIQEGDDDNGND